MIRSATTVLTIAVALPAHAGDMLVYDNTTTRTGGPSFTSSQIGDEITLAGTNRSVTRLNVGFNQQGKEGTGDVQAFLYLNDGADGAPGTLLWQSALMVGVEFTGGDDLVAFEVPNVAVPDTFIWMVQISNTDPVAVGVSSYGPATVGSSADWAWFGTPPNSWVRLDGRAFMGRVVAVPGCTSDLDGSGAVDFGDILAILSTWGNAGGPEDLDGSGTVDFGDLLVVLGSWGPCP